jgi:hypothetical protein
MRVNQLIERIIYLYPYWYASRGDVMNEIMTDTTLVTWQDGELTLREHTPETGMQDIWAFVREKNGIPYSGSARMEYLFAVEKTEQDWINALQVRQTHKQRAQDDALCLAEKRKVVFSRSPLGQVPQDATLEWIDTGIGYCQQVKQAPASEYESQSHYTHNQLMLEDALKRLERLRANKSQTELPF